MSIDWISVKDKPFPKDEENYLGLFKGQFCLIAWNEGDKKFDMFWMPNSYDKLWQWDPAVYEHKLTHWAKLERPEDY